MLALCWCRYLTYFDYIESHIHICTYTLYPKHCIHMYCMYLMWMLCTSSGSWTRKDHKERTQAETQWGLNHWPSHACMFTSQDHNPSEQLCLSWRQYLIEALINPINLLIYWYMQYLRFYTQPIRKSSTKWKQLRRIWTMSFQVPSLSTKLLSPDVSFDKR